MKAWGDWWVVSVAATSLTDGGVSKCVWVGSGQVELSMITQVLFYQVGWRCLVWDFVGLGMDGWMDGLKGEL